MANPALMRTKPAHSHDSKMASIFRDAADKVEGFETPSKNSTYHNNKFRVPISLARTTPFGNKNSRHVGDLDAENPAGIGLSSRSLRKTRISPDSTYKPELSCSLSAGKTPIKTALGSHELKFPQHKKQLSPPSMSDLDLGPSKIEYPQITKANPRMARSSTSSLASDCHSSHGVPLVIPLPEKSEEKKDSIDTWLAEVVSPSTSRLSVDVLARHSIASERKKRTNVYPTLPSESSSVHRTKVLSKTPKSTKPLAQSSNNKENAPPKIQSTRDSPSYPSALMRSPSSVKLSPTRLYSALSPSPLSPLSRPPRRMTKAAGSNNTTSGVPSAPITPFTIHEDDRGSDISPLSPNVEVHRKGRSLKWEPSSESLKALYREILGDDEAVALEKPKQVTGEEIDKESDVFSRGEIRKGKKVLGVSEQSEKLTREKPFVDQADGAPFGFRARVRRDGQRGTGQGTKRTKGTKG